MGLDAMTRADAVVIGGGIAGLSVAARLAKEMRVVVLEAEVACGDHASGRSVAAIVGPEGGRVAVVETASDDRIANMEAFTKNALDLAERVLCEAD